MHNVYYERAAQRLGIPISEVTYDQADDEKMWVMATLYGSDNGCTHGYRALLSPRIVRGVRIEQCKYCRKEVGYLV